MRTVHLVMTTALALALIAAVAAAWTARHYYFRAKLAAAQPVAFEFYAEKNAALRKVDTERARVKPRVVLIGDSRIRALRLVTLEPKWEVVNRGINGETSAQMLIRFADDALALKPDVIIIQSGINDLVAGMGSDWKAPRITARTIGNLKEVASRSAAAGSKVVILTVIPPAKPDVARRVVWSESIRKELASVNAELLAWDPPDGVRTLDLGKVFGSGAILPADYALDTLHLSPTGQARLEELLASLITSLGS